MKVEQPENGQVDQQIRRRPDGADAPSKTTDGFFHSHSFGLAGSQSSPKTRQSSLRPTPNSDHHNGSANSANRSTASRGKSRAVTAWELPELIRPLPIRKQPCRRQPRILAHYPAIVEFIYTNRFATAAQIQRRFSDYLVSYRTAQYQLAGLVRLGYLQTAPVRSTSPNFPYVYIATKRGMSLVKQAYAALGKCWNRTATESGRAKGVALSSILHELLLTEFDLAVQQTIESRGELKRLFLERRFFCRDRQLRYADQRRMKLLIPDSGFLLSTSERQGGDSEIKQRLMMHFTELDNGTMSVRRLQQKFRQYTAWGRSAAGQAYLTQLYRSSESSSPPTFRLLVIVHGYNAPDERRLVDAMLAALDLPSSMRDRIWFTTVELLQHSQGASAPLGTEIWLRARDCRGWLSQYRACFERCTQEMRQMNLVKRRKFVSKRLPAMRHHSLFPASDER